MVLREGKHWTIAFQRNGDPDPQLVHQSEPSDHERPLIRYSTKNRGLESESVQTHPQKYRVASAIYLKQKWPESLPATQGEELASHLEHPDWFNRDTFILPKIISLMVLNLIFDDFDTRHLANR